MKYTKQDYASVVLDLIPELEKYNVGIFTEELSEERREEILEIYEFLEKESEKDPTLQNI